MAETGRRPEAYGVYHFAVGSKAYEAFFRSCSGLVEAEVVSVQEGGLNTTESTTYRAYETSQYRLEAGIRQFLPVGKASRLCQ